MAFLEASAVLACHPKKMKKKKHQKGWTYPQKLSCFVGTPLLCEPQKKPTNWNALPKLQNHKTKHVQVIFPSSTTTLFFLGGGGRFTKKGSRNTKYIKITCVGGLELNREYRTPRNAQCFRVNHQTSYKSFLLCIS